MKISRILLILFCIGLISACGPKKPQTPEQQAIEEAQNDCSNSATSMTDSPHNSNNPNWNAYFEMCMKTEYGYTNEQLKKLWY